MRACCQQCDRIRKLPQDAIQAIADRADADHEARLRCTACGGVGIIICDGCDKEIDALRLDALMIDPPKPHESVLCLDCRSVGEAVADRTALREIQDLCPRCGAKLTWRHQRDHGVYFVGCTRFPDCRYSESG